MKGIRATLVFPIRRRLAVCCAAYLTGIFLVYVACIPQTVGIIGCALLLGVGLYRCFQRKSALFCAMLFLMIVGNGYAGYRMRFCDMPTQPGVEISGVVEAVIDINRVRLRSTIVEGERTLERDVVVTLMLGDDAVLEGVTEPVALVGQRVKGTGRLFQPDEVTNPGGIDGRIWALCDGYELSGYILPGWQVQGTPRFSLNEVFRRCRETLCAHVDALFGAYAPVFRAIMLGEKAKMDDAVVQAMRVSGTAHILAVSGMHLSLIAGALGALFSLLPIGSTLRFAFTTLLLAGFTGLTGAAPGTIRAFLMAVMREYARKLGRRYDPLAALAATAWIMTIVNPLWVLHGSFQFSFFVVLGIHLLHGRMRSIILRGETMPTLIQRMRGSLALSLSAQIAAVPMQLRFYGYLPLLALPMNAISSLFLPVMLLGGWACVGIGFASRRLAAVLAVPIGLAGQLFERLHLFASDGAGGIVRLPAPYLVTAMIFVLLMIVASREVCVKRYRGRICAVLAIGLLASYLPRLDPMPRYVQLDVGQGDGALIRYGRRAALIDVGPEDEYAMLRYLRNEGLFVDLVVLSHLDEDHAGALGLLLESEVEVDRIVMPAGAAEEEISQSVAQALALAEEMCVNIEMVEQGQRIESGEIVFEVLSPREELKGSNERSLVLYADLWGTTLLTLGDLPQDAEMQDVPQSDLLKVAHHGSKYATSRRLIDATNPEVALISVGANSYGHPTQRVLDDLTQAGVDVYRTDLCGCVTIELGESMRVQTFLN